MCTTEGAAEIDFGVWWHTYFQNSVLAYFFLYGSLVYFCCSYGKGTPKKKKKVLATLPHLLIEFIFLALSLLHPYTCPWVVGIQSVFADG